MFVTDTILMLFTWLKNADGSIETKAEVVEVCPPADVVLPLLDAGLKAGHYVAYYVNCAEIPFRALTGT